MPDRFILLPSEKAPLLRLKGLYGGNAAGNTRLAIYSVQPDTLSWIDYQENWSAGGLPKITIDDKHVSASYLREYLESWAHAEGIDRPRVPSDPEELSNVEQAWIDANGSMTSDAIKLRYYKNLKVGGTNFRLDNSHYVIASVSDDRYVWYSLFKGPVGGYDKQMGQYFMVYVPEDAYAWADRLKVVGSWLYIGPRDEHWKLRFNKVTHKLEQGDFDSLLGPRTTNAHPSAVPDLGSTRQPVGIPTLHPYELLQNPFAFRGKVVRLDVGSWPYILNGQVYRWAPMVGPAMAGIQFQRMITETDALYDVMGLDINDASSGLRMLGQIVVLVASDKPRPSPGFLWLVRPLGVESGTNYFGAVIQTPKVQFLRYADQ